LCWVADTEPASVRAQSANRSSSVRMGSRGGWPAGALLLAVLIAQLSCTAVSLLWHTCIIIACCCAMHQTSCRAFYTRRVSTLEAHRLFACCKATEKLLGRHSIAQSRRHCASAQGVDTDQNVVAPKVVEALLGTRFRGREFLRSPLARGPPAAVCSTLAGHRSRHPSPSLAIKCRGPSMWTAGHQGRA